MADHPADACPAGTSDHPDAETMPLAGLTPGRSGTGLATAAAGTHVAPALPVTHRAMAPPGTRPVTASPGGRAAAPGTRPAPASSGTRLAPAPPGTRPAGTPLAPAPPWTRLARSGLARQLALLAGYLAAGIAVTWPRVTYLAGSLPAIRDAGAYVWGFWWMARQVTHLGNPWATGYLAAPVGEQLAYHTLMPLPGLLMTPVTLIFGPSASYNLLSIACPGLLCYAMYRAARL